MPRRFVSTITLIGLAVSLVVEPASAGSVAIVWSKQEVAKTEETATRLRGELVAMGEQVAHSSQRTGADTAEGSAKPAHDPKIYGVDAVMDVDALGGELVVSIWLPDPGQKSYLWATLSEPFAHAKAPERLAIRAAETLHSHLLEVDLARQEPPEQGKRSKPPNDPPPAEAASVKITPVATDGVVRDEVGERGSRAAQSGIALALGGAMLVGTNGLSHAFLPGLWFEALSSSGWALNVALAGLGTRAEANTDEGGASLARYYGLVGVSYQAEVAFARPFAGVGVGVMLSSIEGRANSPLSVHDALRAVGLAELSAGSHLDVSTNTFLTLAGRAQFTQPGLAIYVVDQRAAILGQPSWVASLALGVRL